MAPIWMIAACLSISVILCQGHGMDGVNKVDTSEFPTDTHTMDLKMRGVKPKKDDAYFCTSYPVEDENYIVQYEALADGGTAHHIILFGCEEPASFETFWKCGAVCSGRDQIIFAWAKNAPPLKMPKDVGLHIGKEAGISYIVVQIHYVHKFEENAQPDYSGIRLYVTKERQQYMAGIYLMLAYDLEIPPNTEKVTANVSCKFDWEDPIYPFGYRTHAHSLSTVISGYVKNSTWNMIGKGNPQWPQAFYPVQKPVIIQPGDYLIAQCTYSSIGSNKYTYIGATANDEMCNFYIMYYTKSSKEAKYGTCAGNQEPLVFSGIPADSDVPLPPNPALDAAAKAHHHHIMDVNEGGEEQEKKLQLSIVGNVTTSTRAPTVTGKSASGRGKFRGRSHPFEMSYSNPFLLSDYINPDYAYHDYYDDSVSRNWDKYPTDSDVYDSFAGTVGHFSDNPSERRMSSKSRNRNRNKIFEYANKHRVEENGTGVKDNTVSSDHSDMGGNSVTAVPTIAGPVLTEPRKSTSVQVTDYADIELKFVSAMPQSSSVTFGQVGGLATDSQGNLYVFHRANRVWNSMSFAFDNTFTEQDKPIQTDIIAVLGADESIKRQFGKGRFYMPHGISLDREGNIWLTDVALHQVFRIPVGKEEPDLVLGEKFVPGVDDIHFCKPSDVVVMSTGEFFVSDGYCNARILKFDKNGTLLKKWGTLSPSFGSDSLPGTFAIPHSLALAEDKGIICVADRENGRIQCFDLDGNLKNVIQLKEFGQRLFAIEYCPLHGGILFAVNGPEFGSSTTVQGFTVDLNTGRLLSTWNVPAGMKNPHDVTVDSINHRIYVGEINPNKVWKFEMQRYSSNRVIVGQKLDSSLLPSSIEIPNETGQKMDDKVLSGDESGDYTTSLIIGALLVVPVGVLIIIVIIVRLHSSGHCGLCRKQRKKPIFNIGNFFHSHKGFDRLSTEESDHELDDALDDSDKEEYSISRKA
ncbi:hypothetical protein CHS0354_014344 [Potamilus streckersoni]|uniref:Uncharacterized protein n=1 Tax=Potamilus streckersoni TaxID=2493646 RepID=A0AAE0SKZ9_9BIVA|nr:hypothetical protein CHS0354_014344 [Potamilus streckersoni]